MRAALPLAALLIAGFVVPADAQQGSNVRRVIVYGTDPCPPGSGDIVICARRPERDRYRIPEELRTPPTGGENESWANRAEQLETVGQGGIQSCSTVGPGGFTGCFNQLVRQNRSDRRSTPENRPTPR